jgi:hypothetical protein
VVAGYSDVDWVGNADDRKSTFGGCFYMGNNLVAWMSRKQLLLWMLLFPSQLLRLNTLLLEAVALNYYG